MLEYFEEQLKSANILTSEDVAGFVEDDVSFGCGTSEELTEYYTSRVGQRILFYLIWSDEKLKYQIIRVFENDVESELKGKKFVDMSAATPRFK